MALMAECAISPEGLSSMGADRENMKINPFNVGDLPGY